jgi:hypothetical protein
MKPLFLQACSDNPHFKGMIEDHLARHLAYCRKWDYEYLNDGSRIKPTWAGWDCMETIRSHMLLGGHSHIFWIDADTFVADFSRDMRETLPTWAFMAATIHSRGRMPSPCITSTPELCISPATRWRWNS